MKKLAILSAILAMSVTGFSQSPMTIVKTRQLTVNIPTYISVSITGSPVSFQISDGGKSHTYSKASPFSIISNVPYTVTSSIVVPRRSDGALAPGTYTAQTTFDGMTRQPTALDQGVMTVTVSGLDLTNATPGSYLDGGSVSLTVVDAS